MVEEGMRNSKKKGRNEGVLMHKFSSVCMNVSNYNHYAGRLAAFYQNADYIMNLLGHTGRECWGDGI